MYRKCLFGVLLSVISFSAFASCYQLVGVGRSSVTGIKTKNYEDRLFNLHYVEGHYETDGTSRTFHFGGGCDINQYLSLEVDYREGFRAEVNSYGTIGTKGHHVPFHVQRFAEVRGVGLSLLMKYPFTREFWGTVRVGALVGKERIGITSSSLDGIAITQEKGGVLPMFGAGLMYKTRTPFSFAIEETLHSNNNQFKELSFKVRYHF